MSVDRLRECGPSTTNARTFFERPLSGSKLSSASGAIQTASTQNAIALYSRHMTGKPWSKLKSRVEALWPDDLPLVIHCTSYPWPHPGRHESVSRHWITLSKAILWDFPGPFLRSDRARGGPVAYASPHYPNGGSIVGELLRQYLDRPKAALFEPFDDDQWELTDILRAADRRIGKQVLSAWRPHLDLEHPACAIIDMRLGGS